jgi:glutamate carboxypeptidase
VPHIRQTRPPFLSRLFVVFAIAVLPAVARAELDAEDIELRVAIEERQPEMETTLADWVGRNTGTWNTPGLEAFAPLVAAELAKLGFEVKIEPSAPLEYPDRKDARTGPLVVAERRAAQEPEAARHLLLLGHLDTVFEPDSPFQSWSLDPNEPGKGYGPGASDMKGGLVVLVYALRALAESGDLAGCDVTVLLNSDEEIGSLGSRARIEAAARKAQLGFVFEAAREGGEMARSRSGAGQFRLAVDGVAAHVSSSATEGHSAIVALAKKVLAIESLTDFDRGILLNVGTIAGGTKRNIVPDHANAWIDLRYDEPAEGEEMRAKLEAIARTTDVPGTSATLWGRLHRPPKPATPAVDALLALQQKLAHELGYPAPDSVHSAGVTDGSLTAAVGLPTLDSLGVRGGGAHTERDFVLLRSLSERAAIAAVLLRRLARTPAGDEPNEPPGLPAPPAKLESSGPSPAVIAGSRPVVGP